MLILSLGDATCEASAAGGTDRTSSCPQAGGTKLQSVNLAIGISGSTRVFEQPGPGVSMGLAFQVSRAR